MGHQELPGFFYDSEKRRYFPLKGPIPGTRATAKTNVATSSTLITKGTKPTTGLNKLLATRELNSSASVRRDLCRFLISDPAVWKYNTAPVTADVGLERASVKYQTASGLYTLPSLLAANSKSVISILQLGNGYKKRRTYVSDCIHSKKQETELSPLPMYRIKSSPFCCLQDVSSLKVYNSCGSESSLINYALLTNLGFGEFGGSLSLMNLNDPFDYLSSDPAIKQITRFSGTCWTAACSRDATRAVIGANNGAALVNLETGDKSWVLRCDSDVFAQQFHSSGNVLLCGLRNGAIVTVDIREKYQKFVACPSDRSVRRSSFYQKDSQLRRQTFKLKGKIQPSRTNFMPSAVCCLKSFLSDDCYFVASSMDGYIALYDHRKTTTVQTYDGNANSHSHIHLGVDPSEKYIMSGGEDKRIRVWSINSGELLIEREIPDTPKTALWESSSVSNNEISAWFGSLDGIYRMQWT